MKNNVQCNVLLLNITFIVFSFFLSLAIPDSAEKIKVVWYILRNELPDQNFLLLKFLMEFLSEVWLSFDPSCLCLSVFHNCKVSIGFDG